MRILLCEPGKDAVVTEIGNDLKDMQKVVGGPIGVVYPFIGDNCCIVCNEEGKVRDLPANRPLFDRYTGKVYDILHGTFFVACIKADLLDENIGDITDQGLKTALKVYEHPWTEFGIKLRYARDYRDAVNDFRKKHK